MQKLKRSLGQNFSARRIQGIPSHSEMPEKQKDWNLKFRETAISHLNNLTLNHRNRSKLRKIVGLKLPKPKLHRLRKWKDFKTSGSATDKPFIMLPLNYVDYLFPFLDYCFKQKKLSNILLCLMRYEARDNQQGLEGKAYPGLSEIGRMTAQDIKTVQSGVRTLERLGIVKIEKRVGDSNLYELDEERLQELTRYLMSYNHVYFKK